MPPKMLDCVDIVATELLSSEAFRPFGAVIQNPSDAYSTNSVTEGQNTRPSLVNQGTALKYSNISPLCNNYDIATNEKSAEAVISLFVCSPRDPIEGGASGLYESFAVNLLERHPFTTQTFIPMGLDEADKSTAFLVIVAPSLDATVNQDPDVANLKAFLARGSQAVTYGVGTWHSPMIVIGRRPVSFVVLQHINGDPQYDCEVFELTKPAQVRIIK